MQLQNYGANVATCLRLRENHALKTDWLTEWERPWRTGGEKKVSLLLWRDMSWLCFWRTL